VIFRKQYYLRAVLDTQLTLFRHTGEQFMQKEKDGGKYVPKREDFMTETASGWEFSVGGTGVTATLGLELDYVPHDGPCVRLRDRIAATGARGVIGKSGMPSPSSETSVPGA
jgi:hypothetical protein